MQDSPGLGALPKPQNNMGHPTHLAHLHGGCQRQDNLCHSSGMGHSGLGPLHCANWERRGQNEKWGVGTILGVSRLHHKTHMVPPQRRCLQGPPQYICSMRELGPVAMPLAIE